MTDIIESIKKLKKEKNVAILAHYYVDGQVQDIADYVGDSYYLSKMATKSTADTIIFCGVKFMGESAKILNPNKKILMPDITADCPMAHMVTGESIENMRNKYDDLAVVCYINSTAEIKSLSDVCVTSSNAQKIIEALPNKNIYFVPDNNLANFIANKITSKNIICHNGYCPIHARITAKSIEDILKLHPTAKVLMHPECVQEAVELADYVGSTSEIINFAKESAESDFIIATEIGVMHKLKSDSPNKNFYGIDAMGVCEDMKKITLEKVLNTLETFDNEINLDENLRQKAVTSLLRMHEIAN